MTNISDSFYKKYDELYNKLYYELYTNIINEFKIYEKNTGKNCVLVSDVTSDLLLHPAISDVTLDNDTLILNSSNDYPTITQFISIKFMIFLIKYLEEINQKYESK